MQKILRVFDWRTYIGTVVAVISFSNFMAVLFGQTIPGIFMTFFRYAGETIILIAVFLFALTWLLKAKPHNRPKKYSILIYCKHNMESSLTLYL